MTVYELCELMTDAATVEIFSFEKGEIDAIYPDTKHLTINIE